MGQEGTFLGRWREEILLVWSVNKMKKEEEKLPKKFSLCELELGRDGRENMSEFIGKFHYFFSFYRVGYEHEV